MTPLEQAHQAILAGDHQSALKHLSGHVPGKSRRKDAEVAKLMYTIKNKLRKESMITFKEFLEASNPCWTGYKQLGMKIKNNKRTPNCIPEDMQVGDGFIFEDGSEGEIVMIGESEYQGREVKLNTPMSGDVKKSKVYVKNEKGNVVKVEFGDPNMTIKKHIPERRKSFRARHDCENPGPKTKARYWSCKAW